MVTGREVAQKLGISVSTVGRALANDPRISTETKARVREAAEALGYVGNLAARMMRGGSSQLIGLMIPDVQNDFYASVAQAISECCDRQGYRVVLSITGDCRDTESRHVRDLASARVAGIIIVPTASPRRETVNMLKSVPHVQMLRHAPALGDAWFGIDDESILRDATAHLLDGGHRRIAYVGGVDRLSTGAARVKGVRRAYAAAGVDTSMLRTFLGPPTVGAGEAAADRILAETPRPTAIVTGSAHVTLGVLKTLRRQAIAVPAEMSLVGFGDPIWYEWWGPGITTIQPPIHALAVSCALWFLDQMGSGANATQISSHQAVSKSTLVVRGSTARLPMAPSEMAPGESRRSP